MLRDPRSLSLKARLWLLGLVGSLGVALLAGASLWYAERSKAHLIEFVDQHVALNRHATATYANGLQMGQAARNILLDPGNRKGYENYANASDKFSEQSARLLELLRRNPDGAKAAAELESRIAAWRPLQTRVIELVKAGQAGEATTLLTAQETPAWRAVREILLEQVKHSEQAADSERVALVATLDSSNAIAVAVSAVTFVLVVGATVFVGRGVYRQVGAEPAYTATELARIAEGDLTHEIALGNANHKSILAAAHEMQGHLRDLIGTISAGSQSVLQASQALRQNAESVSAVAEEESTATSAIAAAVEELTVSIGVMSDNAAHAAALSSDTEAKVRDGLDSVAATTDTIHRVAESMQMSSAKMEELSAKVANINAIAATIHDIADQTNLLALNAAIEAARAGDEGRGFSVVADEVRKLADRTRASTREITDMIASVQTSMQAARSNMGQTRDLVLVGDRYTNQVRSAVSGLDEAAVAVRDAVDSIKNALQEQSAASIDIAQRVERIALGIEEAHLSASNSSERSEELLKLAQMLQQQVGKFRTS